MRWCQNDRNSQGFNPLFEKVTLWQFSLPFGSLWHFLKKITFWGVLEKSFSTKKGLGIGLIIHSEEKTKLGIKATNSININ